MQLSRIVRIALSLVVVFGLLACAPDSPRRGRVLVVGIDGATLRIARPMLAAGRLPHLAAIAREGVYGPLRSHMPISSPRIWTSMATGKLPERHGIVGFARDTPDGGKVLYSSLDRRVPALWNIASEAGLRVAVVNWWDTYPPERVDGVIVSDHLVGLDLEGRYKLTGATPETGAALAWPPAWNARLPGLVRDDAPVVDVPDPFADAERFPGWVRPERLTLRYQADMDVARIALAIDREEHPDLLMVFLPGIDRVSHVVWAAMEPADAYKNPLPFTPESKRATADALRGYYHYTDALIGRLAESFGPDDLVMVVSDHGFEAATGLGFLTGGHHSMRAIDGVVFARGPDVAPPEKSANRRVSVNDVAPTVLAWLGLPVGADMDGHPAPFLRGAAADWDTVPTYDGLEVEHVGTAPSGAEDAILKQLEALGYLEGGDAGDATDRSARPPQ